MTNVLSRDIMQTDREERFILRQRGAGKHQVIEADFGFDFPLAPQSSSRSIQARQAPRTSLPAQRLNGRTPTTALRRSRSASEDITRQSLHSQSFTKQVTAVEDTRSLSENIENRDSRSASKRRKFGSSHRRPDSFEPEESLKDSGLFLNSTPVPAQRPSTRQNNMSRPEATNKSREGSNENQYNAGYREEPNSKSTSKRPRGRPPKGLPIDGRTGRPLLGTPTTQSPSNEPARKRGRPKGSKNSAPIILQDEDSLNISLPIAQVVKGDRARKRKTLSSLAQTEDLEDEEQAEDEEDESSVEESDEEQTLQPVRSNSLLDQEETSSQNESDLDQQSDELERENLSTLPKVNGATYNAIRERQQSGSAGKQDAEQMPKRKGKGKSRQSDISMQESQISDRRSTNTISIVVHRLRVPSPEEEDDTASLKGSIVRRGGVNAVDVLSQTCKEMMSKTITLLKQEQEKETNNVKRGEWRRKRKIVEAFGDELDIRCYDLTEALDNNHALLTRLKQTNKKKLELRERLLDIRKEREEVALKMDKARIQNDEMMKAAQEQVDLNIAMHHIELAIDRDQVTSGQDQTTHVGNENLEYLLRSITANVSSTSAEGGLLQSVKDFNAFLERAATVLEGRG